MVFNRPGVAGAVLQTALLLIKVTDGLWKYIQNTVNPKPKKLKAEILGECSSHTISHVSRVTCHMSHVTCHLSGVTCHKSFFKNIFIYIYIKKYPAEFYLTKWWS